MWRQHARPNGAKKNQRSRISHPPTRRDGCTQEELEQKHNFGAERTVRHPDGGTQEQRGGEESPGNDGGAYSPNYKWGNSH
jgi:hypothetical protein